MNTVWTTLDGKTFLAEDEWELVELMRQDTIIPTEDITDFMEAMAYWTRIYTDVVLDTRDPKRFVKSLIEHNLLNRTEMH